VFTSNGGQNKVFVFFEERLKAPPDLAVRSFGVGDVRTRITQSLFNLALEHVLESLGVAQALTASSRIIPGAQDAECCGCRSRSRQSTRNGGITHPLASLRFTQGAGQPLERHTAFEHPTLGPGYRGAKARRAGIVFAPFKFPILLFAAMSSFPAACR